MSRKQAAAVVIDKAAITEDVIAGKQQEEASLSESALQSAPPARCPAGDGEIPVGIAGLDTASGLRRMLGKKALYLSILRRFVNGQKNAVVAIRTALEKCDLDGAERFAHTTKSVAGTIGAVEVQECAAAIEHAVRKQLPQATMARLLDELALPLRDLIAALESTLPPEDPREEMAVDVVKLQKVTAQLRRLFADGDAEAAVILDENADLLQAAYPTYFYRIDAAVKAFDFNAAGVLLESAQY